MKERDFTSEFVIELWPSMAELTASRRKNRYLREFTEFYAAYDRLTEKLRKLWATEGLITRPHTDRGHQGGHRFTEKRMAPSDVVAFAYLFTSTGTALLLWKLLDLWVKNRNGRRYRVKFEGFEFEATQISKRRFLKVLKEIIAFREKKGIWRLDVDERRVAMQPLIEDLRRVSVSVERSAELNRPRFRVWARRDDSLGGT